ncbi:carbamoyltransferase HypF [Methylicorpusculum oleiharenae]|uniref:carbamoyltransferase HypF n=1 Tax=Methylicorpusculum oleiharenae TaxID=1338687 RepID=UPI001E596F64|nr:carbamoyltransferase HypF [Methylicorpusculum oleiharenae]MCD2452223.1 carbamoyltransferase HypF [Methylicorpusculum oleiharenae]
MAQINDQRSAQLLTVSGRVQGVGFRPFISRLAHQLALCGWVKNRAGQVDIFVQGLPSSLIQFEQQLVCSAPPLARPVIVQSSTEKLVSLSTFKILSSEEGTFDEIHVPPDYFTCDDCLSEMRDPGERRFRYPFINCTQCGPRYTLIKRLPYDRVNTSLAEFPLCEACLAEFDQPNDRRYHAQPLACPNCGPSLSFKQGHQIVAGDNEGALNLTVAALKSGLIVAIKGIGGYHLVCDAGSEDAVVRLRSRKHRPDKPFAVMLPWQGCDGADILHEVAEPNSQELSLLTDPLRPIVLVDKRAGSTIAPAVAPGLNQIGIMLPYSPLHHLLADDFGGPLIMTSANISGEPVLTEASDVEQRLGVIADAFLHHNRPIVRPADDSVFRMTAGKLRPVRIGRGFAPFEFTLPSVVDYPVLAVGGQLKNTVAIAFNNRLIMSPHIGDMDSLRSQAVFEQIIADMCRLYGVEIKAIVCDAHPDYRTSRWAAEQGLPLTRVYHHYAHASAVAGEWAVTEPMLVFTWDGAGLGADGSIWGGEGLLGQPGQWQRVCSFRPFRLLGGERAGQQPWRCALALLWETGENRNDFSKAHPLLFSAWQKQINSPLTSSVGRLFDTASALLDVVQEQSYQGQAAMMLESLSTNVDEVPPLRLYKNSGGICLADWEALIGLLYDNRHSIETRAGQFHASLAETLLNQAQLFRNEYGVNKVGFSGGVFQNKRLLDQAVSLLVQQDFEVFIPERVPLNDAGLSFGQLIEVIAQGNHAI